MYRNKSLKKTNQVKLRFSDIELNELNNAMDIQGGETAVWIRELVNREVQQILDAQVIYEQSLSHMVRVH